ncbi:MAG: LAS seventeen-binding protein 3 [Desulfotomaculaceae bacterium]|nr:LAS seventeen-binding protein 3 [Desulfotomaculaceae bacterium]
MAKFRKGNTFIKEKTGSATKINLEGQWEHDFVDDNTPSGRTPTGDNEVASKLKK